MNLCPHLSSSPSVAAVWISAVVFEIAAGDPSVSELLRSAP